MATGRIYLDHAASTPLLPKARAAMEEVLALTGNPSSAHEEGRAVKDLLEGARTRVARVLECRPREVAFTASGTIAAQLALRGVVAARRATGRRLVVSSLEHPAVAEAATALAKDGLDVVRVVPTQTGSIDARAVLAAVDEDVAAVGLMLANHETGMRMPVAAVGEELRRRRIPFLCDACLGPGRTEVRPDVLSVDMLVLSGHKFGGPRGAGLLYVRRRTPFAAPLDGGPQEERVHPGTENVAGAVGLSIALEQALREGYERSTRYRARLAELLAQLDDVRPWTRIGDDKTALPGIATLEVPGVEGEAAMINLDLKGVAVSTGSACAMGAAEPSPSLLAMGYSKARAARTLRISLGEGVASEDAVRAGRCLADVIARLRSLGGARGA